MLLTNLFPTLTTEDIGDAVNKVVYQIQHKISKVLYNNDGDMKSLSFDDLATTVTEDPHLWNEYRVALRRNNVITNVACKEYLFHFIDQNKECIKKQYFILDY